MSRRARRVVIFLPAVAVLAILLFSAFVGLPEFGHYKGPYGFVLNRVAIPERHTTNVVNATVYDYRALDTLGEEFILFTAATGVMLLLRRPGRKQRSGVVIENDAMRVVGTFMVGAAVLVGFWIIAFGFVTPGGGFQGGVMLASAMLLVYVCASYRAWKDVANDHWIDPIGGLGAAAYVVIGLSALISGLPFLANLLGPGTAGTLLSGGTAPFLSWAASLEVAAAFLLLFAEFLDEYIEPLAGGGE